MMTELNLSQSRTSSLKRFDLLRRTVAELQRTQASLQIFDAASLEQQTLSLAPFLIEWQAVLQANEHSPRATQDALQMQAVIAEFAHCVRVQAALLRRARRSLILRLHASAQPAETYTPPPPASQLPG